MPMQHQFPSKVYYLDRLGNMSTSSCITTTSLGGSTSSISSTSSGALPGSNGVRKQILPLKSKQPNSYVQHLEIKGKDTPNVPVTMLELKKKEKTDKNVVTTLVYRKPSSFSSGSISDRSHHHHHHLMLNDPPVMPSRRPGSPSSSGYETDSLQDQENCDVFSHLLSSSFPYHHHDLDMLHSHPIWSPQPTLNNNSMLMTNNNLNLYGFVDDNYYVQ
uniref:Uncharacterized protein n=1 Tax=Caenorhabditis japonica TaxID=281687 RepID=A0A8R1HTW0_CAEJA